MWPSDQPTLGTSAWRLRAPRSGDVDPIVSACQDDAIRRFTLVPDPYGPEHAEEFLAGAAEGWAHQASAVFVVVDDTDEVAGACSLLAVDHGRSLGAIGYWIAPWARGRGAARTAIVLLRDWAHDGLGLNHLVMEIEETNDASLKAATAAGFTPFGTTFTAELKGHTRVFRRFEHVAQGGAADRQPASS